MAKAERKNTVSPTGTWIYTTLMQVNIAMNTATEATLSRMPRVGFISRWALHRPRLLYIISRRFQFADRHPRLRSSNLGSSVWIRAIRRHPKSR